MPSIPVRKGTTLNKRNLPETKERNPKNKIQSNNANDEDNQEMVEDMVEMENDDHDKENVKPSAVMEPHKEDLKTNVTNESSERKEVNAFKTHNPEKPLDTKSKIKQYQHVNKVKTNGANAATKLQGNGKSSERQCNENHSAKAKTRHLSHEEQGARPKTALHGGFEMKGSEIDSEQRGNKVHPMVEGQKKSGSKLLSMVNEPLQQHKGPKFGYLSSKKDLLAENSRLNALLQTQEAQIKHMQGALDSNQEDIARLHQETEDTRELYAETLVRLNIDPETMKPIKPSAENRLQMQAIRETAKMRVESLLEQLGEMHNKSLAGLAFLRDASQRRLDKMPYCVICDHEAKIKTSTFDPVVQNSQAQHVGISAIDKPISAKECSENTAAIHKSADVRKDKTAETLEDNFKAIDLSKKSAEIHTENIHANDDGLILA